MGVIDPSAKYNPPVPDLPRMIDSKQAFDAMVDWVHDELIVKQGAPGFVIGISGTDSALTYMVCAEAFKRAGKPERVVGIHYGEKLPPKDKLDTLLAKQPGAMWVQRELMPWLQEKAPGAELIVDDSIPYAVSDGMRWGALMDWSVIENPKTGHMRPREKSYWVMGTRNATEEALMSYSNVSLSASAQPILPLWKSEILKISRDLGMPDIAQQRSREVDCACGRMMIHSSHIEYVDAMLMARQGILNPKYVEDNISPELRADLENYIQTEIERAQFKKRIPYLPENTVILAQKDSLQEEFKAAKQAAQGVSDEGVKTISALVPKIIKEGKENLASDLVCTDSPNRNDWLPEALALLNTPGLRFDQKRSMMEKIFGTPIPTLPAKELADCSARIGNYGFSFPEWRYLAQKAGDQPSLAESFGMQRVSRENDVRDASLPFSDPERDELGTGFVWKDNDWRVEYRRSYIVCSNLSEKNPTTLVIRNNSHFYGRDRLPSPVYVSWQKMTEAELNALDAPTLENSSTFTKWQDVATSTKSEYPDIDDFEEALDQRLRNVRASVQYLDDFNKGMNNWLQSDGPVKRIFGAGPDHSSPDDHGGQRHFANFLAHKTSGVAVNGKPSLYIGEIKDGTPPWEPQNVQPLTKELANKLEIGKDLQELVSVDSGFKLALLTGQNGDFPVVGDLRSQVRGQQEIEKNKIRQL